MVAIDHCQTKIGNSIGTPTVVLCISICVSCQVDIQASLSMEIKFSVLLPSYFEQV